MNVDGPDGASGEFYVEPEQLQRQAGEFARISERVDDLHRQETASPPMPAKLGTAPPALWLACRLAELSGPDGLLAMMATWAGELADMGEMQSEAAASYNKFDAASAAAIRQIETGQVHPPEPAR